MNHFSSNSNMNTIFVNLLHTFITFNYIQFITFINTYVSTTNNSWSLILTFRLLKNICSDEVNLIYLRILTLNLILEWETKNQIASVSHKIDQIVDFIVLRMLKITYSMFDELFLCFLSKSKKNCCFRNVFIVSKKLSFLIRNSSQKIVKIDDVLCQQSFF